MTLTTFKLEDYLGKYEFNSPHLLCCSDAESMPMHDLLHLASTDQLKLWEQLALRYTEVRGHPLLRETIASSLFPGLSSSEILCTAGAEDGIFCSLFALCEPGDHVIVLTPCYQSLKEIPRFKGCQVTDIELKKENDWRIDLDAIANAITPQTKAVVINFPHNPTGQIISEMELQQLITLLAPHRIWLISDEAYHLLGPSSTQWPLPAACYYPRALSIGVMSKAFGMAGLRIGWVACQDKDLIQKIEQMKHYTSICNSAPSEILSIIALTHKDAILQRNNRIIDDNLHLLERFFKKYADIFEWVIPTGGCVGFVHYKNSQSVDLLCQQLQLHKGVLLLPGSVYDYPYNYFRLGFGRKNMPKALEHFEAYFT